MEFRYSELIPRERYTTDGLDDGGIPLRMHMDPTKEIEGIRRAQADWSRHVKPVDGYLGGIGDPYSFIRVTVPECLPERLELISYANEFSFLYDDVMETMDLKKIPAATTTTKDGGFLDTFGAGALDLKVDQNARPEKVLQARILADMMAIDAPRAITAMKAWATFVQLASRTRAEPFETLDEYIPSRVIDSGELIWFGTLTFGMALTIPESEYELCTSLAKPGYAALGLVNDLYSWDKERAASQEAGLDFVFNAIWVVMRERSVDEDEAKAICRDEAARQVALFRRNVEDVVKGDGSSPLLSRDTRAYLEAVLCSYIGNLVWSIDCPRYKHF